MCFKALLGNVHEWVYNRFLVSIALEILQTLWFRKQPKDGGSGKHRLSIVLDSSMSNTSENTRLDINSLSQLCSVCHLIEFFPAILLHFPVLEPLFCKKGSSFSLRFPARNRRCEITKRERKMSGDAHFCNGCCTEATKHKGFVLPCCKIYICESVH